MVYPFLRVLLNDYSHSTSSARKIALQAIKVWRKKLDFYAIWLARSRTESDFSWPQAARISRPRGVRTGEA